MYYKNIIILLSIFTLLGCNQKIKDGFENELTFTDYSYLGNDYRHLENIELKLDDLEFVNYQSDTICNYEVKIARYLGNVELRLTKNGVSGSDKARIYRKYVEMYIDIALSETDIIYHSLRDSLCSRVSSNKHYSLKNDPVDYSLYKDQSYQSYLCLKSYVPFKKEGYYEFSLPDKYLRISPRSISSVTDPFLYWIPSYIGNSDINGIRFKTIEDSLVELKNDNIVQDFEIIKFCKSSK